MKARSIFLTLALVLSFPSLVLAEPLRCVVETTTECSNPSSEGCREIEQPPTFSIMLDMVRLKSWVCEAENNCRSSVHDIEIKHITNYMFITRKGYPAGYYLKLATLPAYYPNQGQINIKDFVEVTSWVNNIFVKYGHCS